MNSPPKPGDKETGQKEGAPTSERVPEGKDNDGTGKNN